jgi:uncharacterized membrane protein YkvA (DUF1232 family)
MIKEAISIEKSTGNLSDAIVGFAHMNGRSLTVKQRDEVFKLIENYIGHVPAVIEAITTEAKKSGIYNQIQPMLKAAEDYFLAPLDIIPDHLGLLGLLDDAYLAQSLVQSLSDAYKNQTGKMLIPVDLNRANEFARYLIGEPGASMLDTAVMNVLGGPTIQQTLVNLINTGAGAGFNMAGPDPVWGNASMDEIVEVQLGAMGMI